MLSQTGILDLIKEKKTNSSKTFHSQYLITFDSSTKYSDESFAVVQEKANSFANDLTKYVSPTKEGEYTLEEAIKSVNADINYELDPEQNVIVTVRIHIIRTKGLKLNKKAMLDVLKQYFADGKLIASQSVRSTGETLEAVMDDIRKLRLRSKEKKNTNKEESS